jgi:hypothetical protein
MTKRSRRYDAPVDIDSRTSHADAVGAAFDLTPERSRADEAREKMLADIKALFKP